MISIERLYSRQCPKSLNAEQTPKGAKPLTLDDILNIIGQVQHKHMIGSFVLEVRIALDMAIRKKLVRALTTGFMQYDGVSDGLAASMAEQAVSEACDTNICKKCKGNGHLFSKLQSRYNECKPCDGIGRIVRTSANLHKTIMKPLESYDRMKQVDWFKAYYLIYRDAVNELNYAAGDASRYAKELLRRIDGNWSGVD
ncbi:hypothetical protein [Arsukibacterium indicum]|uniref:CR-type domain-containing protein n=1 Tax=Arsukibacterium indicum TaxID=2848612 RepID=A0ABS6MIW9_9GAMM|nr:hypothetical protein [Arsukibacterium indicum]MBV2128177.1 hypothetical protein [Arsukibacterium indicum]